MAKSIGLITAVVFTIANIAVWSYASVRLDAALEALNQAFSEGQIDPIEPSKPVRGLPAQD